MSLGIIGAGRWGSTLANLLCHEHTVYQWGESSPHWEAICNVPGNDHLKPSDKISKQNNLEDALTPDTILVVIPAQEYRNFLRAQLKTLNLDNKNIVTCIKGIENNSGKLMSQIFKEELPNSKAELFTFVGPAQPQDVLKGIPTNMVLAGSNKERLEKIAEDLRQNPSIAIHTSSDLIGCEIGAAFKNVSGVLAGMLDGLGWHSLKGPLMVESVKEVGMLNKACGGEIQTASGLAHLGDFEATLFSAHSNNRLFGEQYVKGFSDKQGKTVEGYESVKGFKLLSQEKGLDLPLIDLANDILFNNQPVEKEIKEFFRSIT